MLHDLLDCYKIKLHAVGYRLAYRLLDHRVVAQVIAVGRRDRNAVYRGAGLSFGRRKPVIAKELRQLHK